MTVEAARTNNRGSKPAKEPKIEVVTATASDIAADQLVYDPTSSTCAAHQLHLDLMKVVVQSARHLTRHKLILPFNIKRDIFEWPIVSYDINNKAWAKLAFHPAAPLAGWTGEDGQAALEGYTAKDGIDPAYAAAWLKAARRNVEISTKLKEAMDIAIGGVQALGDFQLTTLRVVVGDEEAKDVEPSVQALFTSSKLEDGNVSGFATIALNFWLGAK